MSGRNPGPLPSRAASGVGHSPLRAREKSSDPDGPVSRRARKKRATKQAIYEAAVRLFNYYVSKAAVLHEIAGEALAYARRTFDREFGRRDVPVRTKIRASLERFALIVERNPRYYQTVFLDAMRSQAGFVIANRTAAKTLIDVLTGHLRAAQRAGEIDPEPDPHQLAEMLTGIYMYAILSYILQGCRGSLIERIGKAADIFLDGCQARSV